MALNRRTFLRSLGLTGVGLFSLKFVQAKPFSWLWPSQIQPLQLSGTVQAQGKGIAGVAVTDGVSVVRTDAKGQYVLSGTTAAEFVYISIPAGYEFNHQQGVAQFYKAVQATKGTFRADFALQKLKQDDDKHNFIVWADPQIQDEQDANQLKTQSAPDTKKLIDSYGANALFHGIGCGDLIWDNFSMFPDYKQAIGQTGVPFFQVIGNHDMDLDARTDDASSHTFKNTFGPSYYSYNRGQIHYVVLDDVFFLGTSKRYIGYIAEQQFAWLEQDLAQVKPGTTVVVSVHIPVNNGDKRRNKLAEETIGSVVSNRKELYRLLKPYKAHIMSGHTHYNEKVFQDDNIIEHIHGAVCGAWWTGPICYDGTPAGYAVYEVTGSDIRWYYKSTGLDKNYQFRIHPVGALKDRPDQFSVNVWNWDPQWKIEWFEDGRNMGELKPEVSYDPLSVELHAGQEKPARRGWVDPVLTDHMFFAKPSAGAVSIVVQATDRFKNVYRQEVKLAELKLAAAGR
jgi:hypothetical protein